jgi:cytoskeleton protein RodZ
LRSPVSFTKPLAMSSPTAVLEGKTPREIGREMLRLREQFNLTPQEVAERIHIRPRYITAMEEGRYDQMPGKVYARGYIQTYAEFLGMDVAKTITQCFAGEPMPNAQPVPPPAATRANVPAHTLPYGRVAALLAAIVVGGIALSSTMNTTDNAATEPAAPSVAPVPEAMLASMRNAVMPTADNYECLMVETPLGCFYTGAASQLLSQLTRSNRLPYVGRIDVSEFAIAPEVAPEPEPQTPTSEPVTTPEPSADEPAPAATEPPPPAPEETVPTAEAPPEELPQ